MLYEFGQWKVDVDTEKTREFYSTHQSNPCQCQTCRNYSLFCEQYLTQEEKDFFNNLGIVSHAECEVSCFGMEDDQTILTFGFYHITGNCLQKPERRVNDKEIKIGRFKFSFSQDEDNYDYIPDGLSRPSVQLKFLVRTLWLLHEKYIDNRYLPSNEWQLCERVKLSDKMERKYQKERALKQWIDYLNSMNVSFAIVSDYYSGYEIIWDEWFESFVPASEKSKAIEHCSSSDEGKNFLWHMFSFEHVPSAEKRRIPSLYVNQPCQDYYILLEDEEICIKVKTAKLPDISFVNEFNDIHIADTDLSWTYVHTHEVDCGPYYYDKNEMH